MKKLLAILLAAVMVIPMFAACNPKEPPKPPENTPEPQQKTEEPAKPTEAPVVPVVENKVIMGNNTELAGEFRWPGFTGASPAASDHDINRLTVGCGTMELNRGGVYEWNTTVVKDHKEEELPQDDGSIDYQVTIELNPGLLFSDGTEIKAVNYVADILAFSTKVVQHAENPGLAGQSFVGFKPFSRYEGPDTPAEIPALDKDGNPKTDGDGNPIMLATSRVFAGIRLIDEYTFSVVIDGGAGFYPYYYAENLAAFTPSPLSLIFGDAEIEVKDDGEGCYLSDAWYEKEGDEFKLTNHIRDARFDISTYPYSGPYVIDTYDKGTKEVTLKLNPNYPGNFEGQKPSIETIVYIKVVQETQLDLLLSGGVDIITGITGGKETKDALAKVEESEGKFAETHYQRAGYGKIQFECDFGPTQYKEVRQAIAYLLNRQEFCQTFTGGYGVVVDGPYSPDFDMYQAVKDDLDITEYEFSPATAKQILIDGGWIYNSKGEEFVEGAEGVDKVRYKKLDAAALAGIGPDCEGKEYNQNYASVANIDGIEYKTVKVGDDYYMPLVINWFGTTPNEVTDLLTTSLANSPDVAAAGMVIRPTQGDFDTLLANISRDPSGGYGGVPLYGMYNLATGWNAATYDYAYNWSVLPDYFPYSVNKLFDEYDYEFPYWINLEEGNHTKMSYDEAMAASGGKLGMDYLSFAMVYDATTREEFNQWWKAYIERWNSLMPEIPLYSNYYYDIYNAKIQGFSTNPFWQPVQAILYCTIG